MREVRLIELHDLTVGMWGAMDELMAQEMYDGKFQDTVVIIHWSSNKPSIGLGVHEDADQLNVDLALKNGHICGRRYAWGGGPLIAVDTLPPVLYWYQKPYKKGAADVLTESSINGEANARALQKLGFEARYRPIGDTEVIQDGIAYKVISSSAVNLHLPYFWSIVSGLIWDTIPAVTSELVGRAISMPPEKFEDKKVKTIVGRMKPVKMIAEENGLHLTVDQVLHALIEENVKAVYGDDIKVVEGKFTDYESDFIRRMYPFFESESWIRRVSTKQLCQRAPEEFSVGVAAFKARKLIKASIILDQKGRIYDAMYTGDFYVRPQPTITSMGVMEEMGRALKGLNPLDERSLLEKIGPFFTREDVEAPLINPEDMVAPVVRAAQVAQPIPKYLSEK